MISPAWDTGSRERCWGHTAGDDAHGMCVHGVRVVFRGHTEVLTAGRWR